MGEAVALIEKIQRMETPKVEEITRIAIGRVGLTRTNLDMIRDEEGLYLSDRGSDLKASLRADASLLKWVKPVLETRGVEIVEIDEAIQLAEDAELNDLVAA